MGVSDVVRYALGSCVAFAVLAGCGSGGGQSQLAPSGPLQSGAKSGVAQLDVVDMHPDHRRSWMAPGATAKDLLYVSSNSTGAVFVYSYPQDKLVGELTGFAGPDGMCSDKKGDVWITNNNGLPGGDNVVEYKHGGTKQIGSVNNADLYPVSCSVDRTTGNLAVGDSLSYGSGPGAVAIYAHAKGSATYYTVPNMFSV